MSAVPLAGLFSGWTNARTRTSCAEPSRHRLAAGVAPAGRPSAGRHLLGRRAPAAVGAPSRLRGGTEHPGTGGL